MKKFTNPLDKVSIASPCPAKWEDMYGDNRRRNCSDCNLNVYNLSEMTKSDAENFIINSEGRVCVQIHRRSDGTILTKNCLVGFRKLKKRISYAVTAVFALLSAFFVGIFSYRIGDTVARPEQIRIEDSNPDDLGEKFEFGGRISNLLEVKDSILVDRRIKRM